MRTGPVVVGDPLAKDSSEVAFVERDLPRLAALGRSDHATSDRLSHQQPSSHEIDILPAQRQELALA